MKTLELTRTNGTTAQVTFGYEAGDALERPSVFSVKTAEVMISEASIMTESDIRLYAEALAACTAAVGGSVEGEPGLIACIRLDDINFAKLQKEMRNEWEENALVEEAVASR